MINEERLVEIETKIAFQEKIIKDLNDVVFEQQQEMERLGALCNALAKRIKEISEFALGNDAPANERPPHY